MPASQETPTKLGRITHVSYQEGGNWHEWSPGTARAEPYVFAIKFESGWIWDHIVGWRKSL